MSFEERRVDDAPKKGVLGSLKAVGAFIWSIILNKTVEALLAAALAVIAAYFGISSGTINKWIYGDNSTAVAANAENSSEAEAAKKVIDPGPVVADGNIGFVRKEKWWGAWTEFKLLEPGDHSKDAPFTEVKSGSHKVNFSVKTVLSEGGVMGWGSTKTYLLTQGTLEGEFSRSSLVTMVKNGEEEFLLQGLLPEIRNSVQEAEAEIAKKKIAIDDPQYIGGLEERLNSSLKSNIDQKLSIGESKVKIDKITTLKEADLNDAHIEKISSETMTRLAVASASALTIGSSSFSGAATIVFAALAILFLGILLLNIIFT